MNYKKSAFVVDDDPLYADTISLHLRKSGFDVKCFSSGGRAVRQLCTNLDLIVLDYDLGESQTGLQYLREIKTTTPNVPVLFMSNDVKAASQALGNGASYYIEKNSTFLEKLPRALDFLNKDKKSKFDSFLSAFRKKIFSFYNF